MPPKYCRLPIAPHTLLHTTHCNMRGKGLPLAQPPERRRPGALGRAAWAALAPFLVAALLGSLFFRASSSARRERVLQRQVLEQNRLAAPLLAQGVPDSLAAGASPGSSGGAALAAASGGVGGGAAPAAAGELPKLFLFIGILSGRGYRHRRLAVREAWANKAQIPGQVVAKFILSEDERTPQVRAVAGGALRAGTPPGAAPSMCYLCAAAASSSAAWCDARRA